MPKQSYRYVIVGAGLAGASAIEGIRERDKDGSILLIGDEKHMPYNRPPLSKNLWLGSKQLEQIFVKRDEYYAENSIDVELGAEVISLDASAKAVTDSVGNTMHYEKLLLATGGTPRKLDIPGGDIDGVCYYRYLDDYVRMRAQACEGSSAVVIGGGFIGSEMAVALNTNKVDVSLIFPDDYIVLRVFPEGLGRALTDIFSDRGIKVVSNDLPSSIEKINGRFVTQTRNGQRVESDIVIAGIGITPNADLALQAGLAVGNGIVVNDLLQSSNPDIFAAGDNAFFPYRALGEQMRIEHWDNALSQGRHAGRNMAGAHESFTYMPYFFSDLFEFGYEAVGDVSTKLETFADWRIPNDTGTIYYLKDGLVRGVMNCNIWDALDSAREMIREGRKLSAVKA